MKKYFSWGDTIGQNKNGSGSYEFSQANYFNGTCGSGHNLNKDFSQGDAIHDAARANMGSPWKMPTKTQCVQLISYTNYIWTTVNGVNGIKFTSKTNSSKYIFLPAGGFWVETTLNNLSSYGYYWSTTFEKAAQPWLIVFGLKSDTGQTDIRMTRLAGYAGMLIRGVR